MQPLVIIGSGQAAYTLAREWRKLDRATPLRIVTAEDGAAYYKPNLSKAFALGKSPAALVTATAAQQAAQLDAELIATASVTALDLKRQQLECAGRRLDYGQLVLALGAEPIRLSLPGAEAMHYVDGLADYRRLREQLRPGDRVAVVGAGLIGCEFANDLAAAGHAVTVLDVALRPLPRLLPRALASALHAELAKLGVTWWLGAELGAIQRVGSVLQLLLSDGSSLEADHVLCAVGQRPRRELAAAAGLAVGEGIVVDACLRTSAERVYALGDCAEIAGQVRPYIAPITHAAKALAATLAGTPTPVAFPPMPIVVKTPACPALVLPPEEGHDGGWLVSGSGPDLQARYRDREGRLVGFALTGAEVSRRRELLAALDAGAADVAI